MGAEIKLWVGLGIEFCLLIDKKMEHFRDTEEIDLNVNKLEIWLLKYGRGQEVSLASYRRCFWEPKPF